MVELIAGGQVALEHGRTAQPCGPNLIPPGCGAQVVQATFQGSAGPGDFKHHHVRLGAADTAALLGTAAALFRAGPARPGAEQCVYANEPLF